MNKPLNRERGAVLLVALMFLIILTLLSVHSMRSSTMELRLASNEQEQRIGFDSAQSATVTAMASSQLVVTNPGDMTCFDFGPNPENQVCANELKNNPALKYQNLAITAGTTDYNSVLVLLDQIAACPRSISSSARGSSSLRTSGTGSNGNCAYFTVDSAYDATSRRGGRIETREGFVKLLGT